MKIKLSEFDMKRNEMKLLLTSEWMIMTSLNVNYENDKEIFKPDCP